MRPQNKSRSRNKQGNNGGQHNAQRRNTMGNIINRVFESAGPDGKVRGTPQQIIDKYQALARDAQLAGDRVAGESYLQYAEHYSRLLGEAQRQQAETRFTQEREGGGEEGGAGYDPQRRPQPSQQQQPPVASGLAMIDPEDSDDFSGPIETPESRPYRRDEPMGGGGRRQERAERYQARAERGERPREPAPQPAFQHEATAAAPRADPAPEARVEAPAARPAREPALQAPALQAPASQAEVPAAAAPAPVADAAAEPAPAPKRRRRPRAEAPGPAPVVEAE